MAFILTIKINNQSSSTVRITNGKPIFTWDWEETDVAISDNSTGVITSITYVDQVSYDLRIGASSSNLGTSSFVGDLVHLDRVITPIRQYYYSGPILLRGETYYGQVRIKDDADEQSNWATFRFKYNSLPIITSSTISPTNPTLATNLILLYSFFDPDRDNEGSTYIRWFRNGICETEFYGQTTIDSSYLSYGDIWSADILPHDGYEYGPRYSTSMVSVKTSVPVADNVYVSPTNATQNDILKACYDLTADKTDNSIIRWYVNDELRSNYNDQRYVRMSLNPGDQVYFLLTPYDGTTTGSTVSSSVFTILSSDPVADNLLVEGQYEPLNILTNRPIISWTKHVPIGTSTEFISIRIGTFPGSDNIYSEILNSSQVTWQVPANLLRKGGDYYVSVALGLTATSFGSYKMCHFRITGSRWETEVNNATGWTIQTAFVFSDSSPTYSQSGYQVIRFQDGSRFGEIRIYADRLSFVSTNTTESTVVTITNSVVNLVVTGKDNDVKIWVDNILVIDATGEFTQSTTSKLLEIGTVTDSAIGINYKSVFYTTSGAYAPGLLEWSNIQFYTFANFKKNEVKSIEGVKLTGNYVKVVGVNPHDESIGGSIYKISENTYPVRLNTINRTFSPINKIAKSPNEKYKVFAHGRGGTIFNNYLIGYWNSSTEFMGTNQQRPDENGWELVNNIEIDAMQLTNQGMLVDTSFSNTGSG